MPSSGAAQFAKQPTTAVWDDTHEQVIYDENTDMFILLLAPQRLEYKIASRCPRVIVKANGRGRYFLDGYGFTAYNVSGPYRFHKERK